MSAQQGAVIVLLAIGVASAGVSALGVLLARNFYERLHYTAPVATVGVVAVTAALLFQEPFSAATIKVLLICALIVVMNPVLTHATARAARIRRTGEWQPQPQEKISGPPGRG